ncbi:MAG: hypothetical protein ACERKK_03795 [Poseidonibacter sp.]|uniref:hypothetical protein n=1 Tax=Poseidonibacter sp. TaxID=2321188 RepID=UPI00359E2A13
MKILILILSFLSFAYSEQYTFLVNKYDKEIELEAKIISNIANASVKNEIKLFIPKITDTEKKIYSKFFTLSSTCEDSNFIYIKRPVEIDTLCQSQDKIFFTNNYQRLLHKKRFFGAFFWSKSRPNIVFIKDRLEENSINLPSTYNQFIEEF